MSSLAKHHGGVMDGVHGGGEQETQEAAAGVS